MNLKKRLKKFFTLNRSANDGFTLVELIVVIAILGILAGVGTVAYSGYIKKAQSAADEILLDSLNTAFAVACIENGVDSTQVSANGITIGSDKTVAKTDIVVTDPSAKATAIQDAFAKYYEGGEFKVYTELSYASGMFKSGSAVYSNALQYILENFQPEINALQDSAYADPTKLGATKLMNSVGGVTDLAAEMLKNDESKLSQMIDEAYFNNLADILGKESGEALYNEYMGMYAEDEEAARKFLANSTVLSVASTVNSGSYNRDALKNSLQSGNLATIVSGVSASENGLAEAALIYGLYTAYAPDKAGSITGLDGLSALATDTDGFMAYLAKLNDPESQASKDMEGYYAALDIVNGAVTNDSEVANRVMTNGYTDTELVGIIDSVMKEDA